MSYNRDQLPGTFSQQRRLPQVFYLLFIAIVSGGLYWGLTHWEIPKSNTMSTLPVTPPATEPTSEPENKPDTSEADKLIDDIFLHSRSIDEQLIKISEEVKKIQPRLRTVSGALQEEYLALQRRRLQTVMASCDTILQSVARARHLAFPAWNYLQLLIFVGNANFLDVARRRIQDSENVQVIIKPAHRVLNCDMKIPKGVIGWDLNTTPDGGLQSLETDFELVNLVEISSHS